MITFKQNSIDHIHNILVKAFANQQLNNTALSDYSLTLVD